MKIANSNMVLSSESHFEQMDLSLDEKKEKKTVRKNSKVSTDDLNLSQILVDRVSISERQEFEYQSNYSSKLEARSTVKSIESGDLTDTEQLSAMERVIGGVINKDVVISSIQRKEDIDIADGESKTSKVPGRAGRLIQTGIAQGWEMSLKQTDIHYEEETVQFASKGEVTTEDGRIIDFSLDMSLDRSFLSREEHELNIKRWQEKVNLVDPLIVSLDGTVPQLSDATFEFDLDADGEKENISFTGAGSGFIAFDKNNDNIINDGSELFGAGTGNGFEELAAFDEDQNNWIDENDAVFSKLSVWTKDENGQDLLVSLKDAGIGAIALDYASTSFNMTESDNTLQGQLKSTGVFLFENGNAGSIHQIDLAARPVDEIHEMSTESLQKDTALTQINLPDELSLSSVMAAQEPIEEIDNPLKDLLERIEQLRQELEHLYDKMNPEPNQNRFVKSRRHPYSRLEPDPSILLFGIKNPVRTRSRYA